jgi:hypothetical protein
MPTELQGLRIPVVEVEVVTVEIQVLWVAATEPVVVLV